MIGLIVDITAVLLGIAASGLLLLLLAAMVIGFIGFLRDRKKSNR